MDGQAIYDNFKGGDSERLRMTAENVQKLSSSFEERAQSIKSLQERMKASWTGDGADAANAGAGPMERAFAETAAPLDITAASVQAQASGFDHTSNAVVPVPPAPEKPSGWSLGLKSAIPIAGPFMAADEVNDYQQGMQAHNEANENNVRAMDQYSDISKGTQQILPTDYQQLTSDGAAVKLKTDGPGPITPPVWQEPWRGSDRNGSETGGGSGDIDSSTDTSGTGGSGGTGGSSGTGGTGGTSGTGGTGSTGGTGGGETGGTGGGTTTSGDKGGKDKGGSTTKLPPKVPTSKPGSGDPVVGLINNPNTSNPTGNPGTPGPGNPATSGGRQGGSAAGRLLGGGPGGAMGAGEAAARGGNALGAGRGVGAVGPLGGEAGGRGGAAAAAGRGGTAGGPMGGGHGARGQGGEDEEHQRPSWLVEADPDALFGTDERTMPPVIGE